MKSQTLLIIFIICFIASAILSFIPAEKACGGTQSTCYAVQQSGYEETIGRIQGTVSTPESYPRDGEARRGRDYTHSRDRGRTERRR